MCFLIISVLAPIISMSQALWKGVVINDFGEPISRAYVGVPDYKTSTHTDPQGNFAIKLDSRQNKIVIVHLNYEKKTISLDSLNSYKRLVIKLKKLHYLDEIVITGLKKRLKKKENPAYPILKKIWTTRKINALNLEKAYEYQKLSTLEFGGDLSKGFFGALELLNKKDSISENKIKPFKINKYGQYKTPLNWRQVIEHHYVDNTRNKHRTDIEYKKDVRAFKINSFFYERFQNAFDGVNIYRNILNVLDNQFESPISKTGFAVYNYTLIDSLDVKGHKHYKIEFYPRNSSSLAFKGMMEISTPSYTIANIHMTTLKDLNANLIKKITLRKIFTIKNDSVYLPKRDFSNIEFSISRNNKAISLYLKRNDFFDNYKAGVLKTEKFYNEKLEDKGPSKGLKENKFLDSISSETTIKVEQAIKAIQKNKKIQFGVNVFNILASGYIPITNNLQMGNIIGFYTHNGIEGSRYNIGFRTFKNINDRFRTYFYYGYGVGNKRSNFGISPSYMISRNPEIRLNAYYVDDLQVFSNAFRGTRGIFSQAAAGLIVLRNNNFVSKIRSFGVKAQISIKQNLRAGISFSKKHLSSADTNRFNVSYFDGKKQVSKYEISPIGLYLTYTPNRKVLGKGIEQNSIFLRHPSFSIEYLGSPKNIFNNNLSYNKLQFSFSYPFILGRFGILDYSMKIGKTYGKLPVLLLDPVSSNPTAISTSSGFLNLNQYDFVMDTYAYGGVEHHFNGYIFNKIPLVNKLRIRSVLSFNIVYGSVSQKNIIANKSSIVYNTPNPYYEYGFGIENIGIGTVRIFRINFVWRGPMPTDFVNSTTRNNPEFGVQFQIQQLLGF